MENDTLTQNWCAAAMQHLQYLANIPAEVHFSQRMFFCVTNMHFSLRKFTCSQRCRSRCSQRWDELSSASLLERDPVRCAAVMQQAVRGINYIHVQFEQSHNDIKPEPEFSLTLS